MYKMPENFQAEKQKTHFYMFGQNSNTRGPLAVKLSLKSESPDFNCQRRRSMIQKFIVTLTGNIRSYVTTISFQTLPIFTSYRTHSDLKNYSFNKELDLTF